MTTGDKNDGKDKPLTAVVIDLFSRKKDKPPKAPPMGIPDEFVGFFPREPEPTQPLLTVLGRIESGVTTVEQRQRNFDEAKTLMAIHRDWLSVPIVYNTLSILFALHPGNKDITELVKSYAKLAPEDILKDLVVGRFKAVASRGSMSADPAYQEHRDFVYTILGERPELARGVRDKIAAISHEMYFSNISLANLESFFPPGLAQNDTSRSPGRLRRLLNRFQTGFGHGSSQ